MNENLKAVWKYYLLFFVGVGCLWLGHKLSEGSAPGWIHSALFVVGALLMFCGALMVMMWNLRKNRTDGAEDRRQKRIKK